MPCSSSPPMRSRSHPPKTFSTDRNQRLTLGGWVCPFVCVWACGLIVWLDRILWWFRFENDDFLFVCVCLHLRAHKASFGVCVYCRLTLEESGNIRKGEIGEEKKERTEDNSSPPRRREGFFSGVRGLRITLFFGVSLFLSTQSAFWDIYIPRSSVRVFYEATILCKKTEERHDHSSSLSSTRSTEETIREREGSKVGRKYLYLQCQLKSSRT